MKKTADMSEKYRCPQCGAPISMPKYADMAVCASCGSTLARDRGSQVMDRSGAAVSESPVIHGYSASSPRDDEHVLRSVRCPQCAGPLAAREGKRVLLCAHCGVRVVAKIAGGYSRWHLPARVNRLGAMSAGRAWLDEYPGIAGRARRAHLAEAQLLYAPIWEHKALIAGWEFGHKLRTKCELVEDRENERLDLQLVREAVEEPHLRERRFYQSATSFEAFGATRPRVTGHELALPLIAGELEPFATVLDAMGTASAVADRGRKAALEPVSGATSPDSHLFVLRESTTLLYYPMWLLRYQEGNRTFRVVVNGCDGTINSGTAPAANRRRVMLLGAKATALVTAAAVLVWLGTVRDSPRVSMFVVAVILSAAAILLVWRFRMQGEVEYHEPFSS